MFEVGLLKAINDWQRGGNANQKTKRGKALKAAASRLPIQFRKTEGKCFRQIALDKKAVWQVGTQYQLKETLSSWTENLQVAETFKGGVPPLGYQGVIFELTPSADQVVINLSALFESPDFARFVKLNKGSVVDFDKGIGRYGNSQAEIVVETAFLPLNSLHSWGGYTSPENELAKMFFGKAPSKDELEWFRGLMKKAGHNCGPYWLSTSDAVQRVSEKLKVHGTRLSRV
jgi:hypothetical protein